MINTCQLVYINFALPCIQSYFPFPFNNHLIVFWLQLIIEYLIQTHTINHNIIAIIKLKTITAFCHVASVCQSAACVYKAIE